VDVVWQIAEQRGCDEVVTRYDCGHAIRADVWAPALPKTREYGSQWAERRRFMQHSMFVLTRDPGAPRVQVTIPEGRCRHCGRGLRQVLICGPLQMDLSEDLNRAKMAAAAARRLELPLSSHVFLAAMGQVCRFPENITPPPLLPGENGTLRPFDGPPLPREGLHQWSRREVEDELKGEIVKYVGFATSLLCFAFVECLYLCAINLGPLSRGGDADGALAAAGELSNLTSVSAIEMGVANSTWVLSALTVAVHKAFGPSDSSSVPGSALLWSTVVHPLWIIVSMLLAPLLWILDLFVAVPRLFLMHVWSADFESVRGLVWRPWSMASWLLGVVVEVATNSCVLIFRCLFSRSTAVLSQVPVTSPMLAAILLCTMIAALSAPQPPSLSLLSVCTIIDALALMVVWTGLPSFELVRGLQRAMSRSKTFGPLVQRMRVLWASARKEGRPKGGSAARGQKDRSHADRSGRERSGVPGRTDKAHAGRAPSALSSQPSAPDCFVCLDRPSRYVLEPCGHRVVCGDCAVQLVEAAARNRSMCEAVGGAHHASERGGGACPSCGKDITRAMRMFS